MATCSRRDFVSGGAAAIAAAALPTWSVAESKGTVAPARGWQYESAGSVARAIRSKQVSSVELTRLMLERVEKLNSRINAVVTLTGEQALRRAAEADRALAAGTIWGPLHGVPCTIKDCFETEGVRTTAGAPFLKDYVPKQDAAAVARLRAAGMIMLGKTNVPLMGADHQSYNDVFPTANNPWDFSLTPGGSTGGGAAATAAGLGFLALGADIAGSIRVPAHFCGIFGHKPTFDVVPLRGQVPPPPGTMVGPMDLGVAGPLARSASDLRLALTVLGGPDTADRVAYNWTLPPARKKSIRDYKIRYVLDHPLCRVTTEVGQRLQAAVNALRTSGAQLEEGFPDSIDVAGQYRTYLHLFWSAALLGASKEYLAHLRASAPAADDLVLTGAKAVVDGTYLQWAAANEQRYRIRAAWRAYFREYDAFLMPASFVPAFPHDHSPDWFARVLQTPEGPRRYTDLLFWPSFAIVSGLPATAAPVGLTKRNLPVGIQIMGPWLEDAASIFVAEALEPEFGFQVPKGFE